MRNAVVAPCLNAAMQLHLGDHSGASATLLLLYLSTTAVAV